MNWTDIADLSAAVPLLARVYPNGSADVNHFHAAGGTACLFRQLLGGGFMHADAKTGWGSSFADFTQEAVFNMEGNGEGLRWRESPLQPLDLSVLTTVDQAFSAEGGLRLLEGNLGRSVIKVSAVAEQHRIVEAPAIIIDDQDLLADMFKAGELNRDCVVVVRFQGPRARGMPELHKLTPFLSSLQDKGYKVALVTDGRMSGASGKVPAAIHLVPEAAAGGLLNRLQNGDIIRVDAMAGELQFIGDLHELQARTPAALPSAGQRGCGRELFGINRLGISNAEQGASYLFGGS
jgi:phosphogluconate dehydratase